MGSHKTKNFIAEETINYEAIKRMGEKNSANYISNSWLVPRIDRKSTRN